MIQISGTDEEIGKACWDERRRIDGFINDGAPCPPYPPWEHLSEEARASWRGLAQRIRDGRLSISAAAAGRT